MTPEQYGVERAYQHEQATRQLMALLIVSFPHLARDIDTIGRNWDGRLDALDSQLALQIAAKSVEPVGAKEQTK